MGKTVNDIPAGLRIPSQVSLNPKQEAVSENALKNLGTNNTLAYTYYHGMTVFCIAEESTWVWRRPKIGEQGLLPFHFQYPAGRIVDDINYGGLFYNFFKVSDKKDIDTLINSLNLTLDWKKDKQYNKPATAIPSLAKDNVYSRKGYIGYLYPILASGQVLHPIDPEIDEPSKLFQVNVLNLGVKIKDYNKISAYDPKLHISRYTYSKRKGVSDRTQEVNGDKDLDYRRKGSFKLPVQSDPIRPSVIPLKNSYQILDFGQEHYFATEQFYASNGSEDVPLIIHTRGNGTRYSQVRSSERKNIRAFVYLELQVSVTIDGIVHLSKPLQRIKMFVNYIVQESDPAVWNNFITPPTIRYKLS